MSASKHERAEIAVVGAGHAGLAAAGELVAAGKDPVVLEASDAVGGRVRTDNHEGFLLDRGFQVYLTAYPEGQRVLDYAALDLKPFEAGALVNCDGRLHKIADPLRRPELVLDTLRAGIGTLGDKLRVVKLRNRAVNCSLAELWQRRETTALEALREIGFSASIIQKFFRPWLGGIFLTRELDVSSRAMDFVVRMMAKGDVTLPSQGMESISRQLARRAGAQRIRLNSPVASIEQTTLRLADGSTIEADHVVLATEAPVAARLLGKPEMDPGARSVTCLYFAADSAPIEEPWLVLNGDRDVLVNHLVVPSNVSRAYAPAGQHQVSATVLDTRGLGDEALVDAVRGELRAWHGAAVDRWQHLRTYRIAHAQPMQSVGFRDRRAIARRWGARTLVTCGDHVESASIQGALLSGRRAAEHVLESSRRGASEAAA